MHLMHVSSFCRLGRAFSPHALRKSFIDSSNVFSASLLPDTAFRVSGFRCFAAASTPAMEALKARLKDPELLKQQIFVGGQWIDADSGETVDVSAPVLFRDHAQSALVSSAHTRYNAGVGTKTENCTIRNPLPA